MCRVRVFGVIFSDTVKILQFVHFVSIMSVDMVLFAQSRKNGGN